MGLARNYNRSICAIRRVFLCVIVIHFCGHCKAAWWEVHWRELESAYETHDKDKLRDFISNWERASQAVLDKRRLRDASHFQERIEELVMVVAIKGKGKAPRVWLQQPELEVAIVDEVRTVNLSNVFPSGTIADYDRADSSMIIKCFSVRRKVDNVRVLLHDGQRITSLRRFVTGKSDLLSMSDPPTVDRQLTLEQQEDRLRFVASEINCVIDAGTNKFRMLAPCFISTICVNKEMTDAVVLVSYEDKKLVALNARFVNRTWLLSESDILRGAVVE